MSNFQIVNPMLLSVKLNGAKRLLAKLGSMAAYQGTMNFSRAFVSSGGLQELAARTVTSEGLGLMQAEGSGEIFLAFHGCFVTVIPLNGDTMYLESERVLAFEDSIRASIVFLGNQGAGGLLRGAVAGQGLFTTTLTGHGEIAVLSDGSCIPLQVTNDRPVFVDPNAYVGHLGNVTSSIATGVSWKTLIGQGSGEGIQLKFTGNGKVYIQASEKRFGIQDSI